VGDGVLEMRIHHGKGYRLYFKVKEDQIILLLIGGDKSTQEKDIKKAIQLSKKEKG
jgi:putative addiction module killer protein